MSPEDEARMAALEHRVVLLEDKLELLSSRLGFAGEATLAVDRLWRDRANG